MPDLHLADLSDWNPGANFEEYAAGGRPGVFLKATEGTSFRASTFAGYRAAAHAAGLVFVGLYHFAKGGSADAEAQHFLDTIGTLRPGEVAVLDAEVAGLDAAWCRRWLGIVMEATGRDPLLYCSWSYWGDALSNMTDCPLWIAAYHGLGHDDPRDTVPNCRFWQFTDRADVAGVGSADDSVFRGTVDDLAALAGGGSAPNPDPDPIPDPPKRKKVPDMFLCNHGGGIVLVYGGGNKGWVTMASFDPQVTNLLEAGVPTIGDVNDYQWEQITGTPVPPIQHAKQWAKLRGVDVPPVAPAG